MELLESVLKEMHARGKLKFLNEKNKGANEG
jgi:hypothetical protein